LLNTDPVEVERRLIQEKQRLLKVIAEHEKKKKSRADLILPGAPGSC
jgi:hypothetical protein